MACQVVASNAVAPSVNDWSIRLTAEQLQDAETVAHAVGENYERGQDRGGRQAKMKYMDPTGRSIRRVNLDSLPAELAVALRTDQPWHRGDRALCDVGKRTEVRHTNRGSHLLLYRYDHDARFYVLVTGNSPYYQLEGWIDGRDGRVSEFRGRENSFESWWVPARALNPMRTFPDLGEHASRGKQPRDSFPPRLCPVCHDWHPVMTTCAWGIDPYIATK